MQLPGKCMMDRCLEPPSIVSPGCLGRAWMFVPSWLEWVFEPCKEGEKREGGFIRSSN